MNSSHSLITEFLEKIGSSPIEFLKLIQKQIEKDPNKNQIEAIKNLFRKRRR